MNLSAADKEILFHAQLRADASAAEIGRHSGHREHTVRYTLDRMKENGVAVPFPFINVYPLGFEQYGIFFSLAAPTSRREQVLKTLMTSERVAWILELGGDYQYGVAVYARRSSEVAAFLEELSERFGQIFYEKSIATRVSWELFPRRYLTKKRVGRATMRCGDTGTQVAIQELDHRILQGLTIHRFSSYRELARLLEIPHTTLSYRLRTLAEKGVIAGMALGLDVTKLGMQPYRLLLYVTKLGTGIRRELRRYCAEQQNVFALIECLGSWDFELKVEVDSPADLISVTNSLYDRFGNDLHTIKVLSVLRTRKLAFYPFQRFETVMGVRSGSLLDGGGDRVRPAWD